MNHKRRANWLAAAAIGLLFGLTLAGAAAAGEPASMAPADVPEQLATDHIQSMTANSTHIFYTISVGGEFCPADGEPALKRVPLGGGTVQTLYHSCTFDPYQLAADDTHVYFADWHDDKIKRIPVAGGAPTVVTSGSSLILHRGLALDSTHVYWGDHAGIRRLPKAGGAVQVLAADTQSVKLAVDGTHVYWSVWGSGTGQVRRVAKTGGAIQNVVTGRDDPYGLALDATTVYFTELGTGQVYRVGKDGTGLTAYVAADISPYMAETIAVNDTHVFWTDTTGTHTGRVRRVLKGGGTVENLALGLFGPRDVTLTSTHVYWGDYDGVWRLPIAAAEAKVDLTISDIEVTQAIQCLDNTTGATACADNSVPLIANKLTYVRVYPAVDLADTVNVNARLFGTKAGAPLPGSPIAPNDTTVFVSTLGAQRESPSSSFNFQLPTSWRSGIIVLQAEINPGTVIPESNTANNMSSSVTVSFAAARNLSVAYVPVNYTWSGWTGAHTASAATMTAAESFLRTLFPVSQLTYFAWPSGSAFNQNINVFDSALITELNNRYLASTSPPDQVFGWLPSGSWNNGLSDPTWLGGAGHVSAGDEALQNAVIAHEIGHNLGRRHPTCADPASDWPYGVGTSTIQEVGFDVFSLTAHVATKRDWMVGGNCGNSSLDMWISPWNWTQVLNGTIDWLAQAQWTPKQQEGPMAIVSGQVTEEGGELNPLWLLDEDLPPMGIPEGNAYCLRFFDGANLLLRELCFDVDISNRRWTGESTVGTFGMRLPFPPDTALVQLSRGMEVLDERHVSENVPEVHVIRPNGGELWEGIHVVEWEAGDPDMEGLTYNVLYSPDGGESWQSLAAGLTEPFLEVDSAQIPGTEMGLMRVLATDGILTGRDQSDEPFRVAPHPPAVHILQPEDGAGYEPGEQIVLTGSAYDLEDGRLEGDRLRWSIEGVYGQWFGEEVALRIEEPGAYLVTLEAYDSHQMVGQDRITIFVGPTLSITPPYVTVGVPQTITVELRIHDVLSLYGAQVELAFDPEVVEVVDAYDFLPGVQILEGDFPVPDTVIRNQVDNQRGTIQYAASLQGDKPGVSGSGALARIVFHSKEEGISTVRFVRAILSDPQSVPIPFRTEDGVIVVRQAVGLLTGRVILERRTSNAGAQVCVNDGCAPTADDGSYMLADVPPGPQTVFASRESYLRSWRQVDVPVGPLALPEVTLLGGDVNGDDHIEQFDAMSAGLAWNTTPMDAEWDRRADVTADSNVNILDMVAIQFNWDQVAPGPWDEAVAVRRLAQLSRPLTQPDLVTRVVIHPSQANLSVTGQTVDLDIRVEQVTDLYGGRVQLSFDPSVLQVRDADPRGSAPGVQIRPGDFLDPFNQFVLVNQADNTAGTIDFAVTQLHPATARSGSGVLATVTFEALAQGSSAVHFVDVRLGDDTRPDPVEIPAQTQDGLVTVGGQLRVYLPMMLTP